MVFTTLENVRKIILIFLLIGSLYASNDDDDTPYIVYAKAIMTPFIQKCEKEYQLDCIGTGGRFAYNVAGINIEFVAYQRGTIEEARTLEVKMIEALLAEINAHEKIRPFLAEYPFNAKDIHISTSFQKNDGTDYTDGSVVYVHQARGKLFYKAEDPKTGELTRLLEEPYEEALKIVQNTPGEMTKKEATGKIKV